jgi:prophage regulatory protein
MSGRQSDAYWRLPTVRAHVGLGRSTIYRRLANGEFPMPYDLGGGRVAWLRSEVEDWMARRPRVERQH